MVTAASLVMLCDPAAWFRPAPETMRRTPGAVAGSRGVFRLMARGGGLRRAKVDLRGAVSRRSARGLSGLQSGDMSHGWRDGESRAAVAAAAAWAEPAAVGGESSGTMKSSWERPGGGGLHPALK